MHHAKRRQKSSQRWGKRSRSVALMLVASLMVVGMLFYMGHSDVVASTGTQTTHESTPTAPPAGSASHTMGVGRAKTAEELTAPLMALPLLCNPRNTRPLTPRPREYDPSKFDVLIGILSLDNDDHAGLRATQRESWFWYRDVAKPSNGFGGRLMVEYCFGAAYENNYTFSDALRRESEEHANILVMDLKEMRRRSKKLLTSGAYSPAVEVTRSIKALAFYCYAEQTYLRAKFIVKADDDEFIRVPAVMRTVEVLPSYGVLWGGYIPGRWVGNKKFSSDVCCAWGSWSGMSRDVLHLINSLYRVQQYGALEVTKDGVRGADGNVTSYRWIRDNTEFVAEDLILGISLHHFTRESVLSQVLGLEYRMSFYWEPRCRVHNPPYDRVWWQHRYHVNPFSMVLHHANHSQQMHYRSLYPDDGGYNVSFVPRGDASCFDGAFMRNTICDSQPGRMVP